ncbi:DUF2239 family protein [Aestuariivirga sp. YIM B02566]|uniref:DUF2239 family protein n=1 Tax=Taklimakanibacter albus TaxID=2800327 RepID=A0ACC5QZF5_9HYPH|nr:DUF2239 family protein [Aestuariivirga sp. YIM B02566]MBK1865770.1 DUF2239 family protein [Aestuariivirga sp. YIM B02566]
MPALSFTAFTGPHRLAGGAILDVALAVKAALAMDPEAPVLTFNDATGAVVDLDLRGGRDEIAARLDERFPQGPDEMESEAPRGPGRPKLGVIAREVTLLPRHWEWLGTQRGGASHALRRLVDDARRADQGASEASARRDAAYRFMSAMAGNLSGFEEASRALFAGDAARFGEQSASWPEDIRDHVQKLAWG